MAALNGMSEIVDYYEFSAPTILALIRNRGFPAVKLSGGMWTSDTELIDQWRMEQILGKKDKKGAVVRGQGAGPDAK